MMGVVERQRRENSEPAKCFLSDRLEQEIIEQKGMVDEEGIGFL